jgi:hypothetical protein
VLLADAMMSGATGLLMVVGATLLAPLLVLLGPLLRYARLVLLPFAAFVAFVAMRPTIARGAVWAVIAINALWVLDSLLLLLTGWVCTKRAWLRFCAVPSTRSWGVRRVAVTGIAPQGVALRNSLTAKRSWLWVAEWQLRYPQVRARDGARFPSDGWAAHAWATSADHNHLRLLGFCVIFHISSRS